MYRGRFLTSVYIFPIYSPIIPKKSNCTPPSKYNGATVEVQPGIAPPNIFTIRLQDSISRAKKETNKPTTEHILKGTTLKDVQFIEDLNG